LKPPVGECSLASSLSPQCRTRPLPLLAVRAGAAHLARRGEDPPAVAFLDQRPACLGLVEADDTCRLYFDPLVRARFARFLWLRVLRKLFFEPVAARTE
jgi:hypothetical protein